MKTGDFDTTYWLKRLCESPETQDRASVIRAALHEQGIKYTRLRYPDGAENILVYFDRMWDFRQVYGAHYDVFSPGKGANDNGMACLTLIQLAVSLSQCNYRGPVAIVFFDAEEPTHWLRDLKGNTYSGSTLFARSLKRKNTIPDLCVILDVVGRGDTVFYSAARYESNLVASQHDLVKHVFPRMISKSTAGSDDVWMHREGIPSILLSVLPKTELTESYPPTWTKIHSVADDEKSVDPENAYWLADKLHDLVESQDVRD